MQRLRIILDPLQRKNSNVIRNLYSSRSFSTDIINENENKPKVPGSDVKLSGFAKAFEKFNKPEPEAVPEQKQSFATLLRYSKLIDLGDPQGRIVTGKIFHVVGDDLYIDFGWKFHCVCTRPLKNAPEYVRGATVRLRIKELELSTKFLGAKKDLTILEADCTLLGLIDTPMRHGKTR